MGWPEVFKALHLLLPFIRELFFGKRRIFHNLSKDQINTMITSLGIGIITLVTVVVLTSAIHKETELNEEIRGLRPYEEIVNELNATYGVDLLAGGTIPLDPIEPDAPLTPDYSALWEAYKDVIDENRRLIDQCYPDTALYPENPKAPVEEKPERGDQNNKRVIENLKGLWK